MSADYDEHQWLMQAKVGDAEAFSRIVEAYSPRLHGYVARYVLRAEDVLDIVQDSFIDAFQNLHQYNSERPFTPWIYAICKHRMYAYLRAHQRQANAHEQLVHEALIRMAELEEDPQAEAAAQRLQALEQCLQALQGEQRELIEHRYMAGLSMRALADRIGKSVDSLGMRLSRLRANLRRCIETRIGVDQA